jgi:NTP pyrophosphatase (non-canonical NTP hydrolase)
VSAELGESLLAFLEAEYAYQSSRCEPEYLADIEKRAYGWLAKLGEEAGELNAAVLAFFERQSARKADQRHNVAEEIADVVFCALLIGRHLDIDIAQAIRDKAAKVESRRTTEPA